MAAVEAEVARALAARKGRRRTADDGARRWARLAGRAADGGAWGWVCLAGRGERGGRLKGCVGTTLRREARGGGRWTTALTGSSSRLVPPPAARSSGSPPPRSLPCSPSRPRSFPRATRADRWPSPVRRYLSLPPPLLPATRATSVSTTGARATFASAANRPPAPTTLPTSPPLRAALCEIEKTKEREKEGKRYC
uniref:Uncharacterized protein n=1 Tax=Oryza sativa subsp. japonica TaxID=39947 RepID=Q5Z5B5_ORYSJ|nr:hypothetical protein [Oryza sativa Japonica Group]